ncbi:HD domain-containing protein [bacterium]|nr:MAG: HD domain-containing protein [bacterium]
MVQASPLVRIARATAGTEWEGDLYLVGGAVRDDLLGKEVEADYDLVTTGDAPALARFLWKQRVSEIPPVTYERFGTAMVRVEGTQVELVTARKESYDPGSRKPKVERATLREDAERRDFTANTLMRRITDGELIDSLGMGLIDLQAGILRTPLDPQATFADDPLRMLRAVRFRWKLGFTPAPGLYEAIRTARERLRIVSPERIRDEVVKMLGGKPEPVVGALRDLMDLGLIEIFAPALVPMVGCEQGDWHDSDVWDHTLRVVANAGSGDLELTLAALLHDVGKPATRTIHEGHVRFFGHEKVGAEMTREILRDLRFPQRDIEKVAGLVRNHMRLGSGPFTEAAARRLIRDMGDDTDRLLHLVDADANALRAGVRALELGPIRETVDRVRAATPADRLESPLDGREIAARLGIAPGPEVGRYKTALQEAVLEGRLLPGDKERALELLAELAPGL